MFLNNNLWPLRITMFDLFYVPLGRARHAQYDLRQVKNVIPVTQIWCVWSLKNECASIFIPPNGKRRQASVLFHQVWVFVYVGKLQRYGLMQWIYLFFIISGLFGKSRKSKTIAHQPTTHSKDSLNTVFTNNSDPDSVKQRQAKRLLAQPNNSLQITLRKRDSKATTSSSGNLGSRL